MLTKVDTIIRHIEATIEDKLLFKGDQLPSLTQIMKNFQVSRDTVVRAYRDLNNRGIIDSIQGKGYFVTSEKVNIKMNLFLLLDELSSYKNTLVKSIENELKNKSQYQIFFHHYNIEMFQRLIEDNIGKFTHYAISPFPGSLLMKKSLERLPENKLIILDRHDGQSINRRFVGQDFFLDISDGLNQLRESVKKYKRFVFVFPEPSYHPVELKKGFENFCKTENIPFSIVPNVTNLKIRHFDAYLVIDDNDLAVIVKNTRDQGLNLGKDIGLVSYNETPLKSVVSEGITTISTDFHLMGQQLVKMLFNPNITNIHNTSRLIRRKSL